MNNSAPVKCIISGEFPLKRYPGKGGWTYCTLPKPGNLGKKKFGQNKVDGKIDHYKFKGLSIWNTKAGDLFFPVKADIRKIIGKSDGDFVKIEIYAAGDSAPELPPDPLHALLAEEPEANRAFRKLSPLKRTEIEAWVNAARSDEGRVQRLAQILDRLTGGLN